MNVRAWIQGMLAVVIGAAGSAISLVVVDPSDFNFDTGLQKLGKVVFVNSLITLGAYLKQHPLPTLKRR